MSDTNPQASSVRDASAKRAEEAAATRAEAATEEHKLLVVDPSLAADGALAAPVRTVDASSGSDLLAADLLARRAASEAEADNAVAAAPDSPDLRDPAFYFNRELSWLEFNDRVLQLAEDERLPLLERMKFVAIWESNLDEFFMVRVATLHDQVEAGLSGGPDGLPPNAQIDAIRELVVGQRQRLGACVADLRLRLAEANVRILDPAEATAIEQAKLRKVFYRQVFPTLTPLVVGLGRPFPYISNLSLSLAVLLRDPEQNTEVVARVKVPKEVLGRFIELEEDGRTTLVALEDVIAANLREVFPGMEVLEHAFFRLTRDTDYDISDEADDVMQAVEEELRRRRFGEVVRLEITCGMNRRLLDPLIEALEIEARQVYEIEGPIDMSDLWDVVGIPGHQELRNPPYNAVTQPRLLGEDDNKADVFAAMRDGDIVVHHPYDSFTNSVVRFVKQAVADPDVLAIKQTVYRTSADSPLVPALIDAAERGKQAVCMVEIKARFDEQANIRWAKKMEQAGVHVVYGLPALKTHAKCVLVVRREGDGVRHYVHIGTGNYNPKTARIYSDVGLFTADPDIGADVAEMFNYLTGYSRPRRYRKVLVAPLDMHKGIVREIEKTVASHSAEHPARIRMKMNSLLDPSSIRALYRASQAGVKIELNVRGICALKPGVPGVSDNITVVSIVGRFLEHARVYSFERHGEPETVYIGSADLMPRNLFNRVELLTPVLDESVRAELNDILDRSFSDNTNSWALAADGVWTRHPRAEGVAVRSLQAEMMDRAHQRAKAPR